MTKVFGTNFSAPQTGLFMVAYLGDDFIINISIDYIEIQKWTYCVN
jgi:hypothetical protein